MTCPIAADQINLEWHFFLGRRVFRHLVFACAVWLSVSGAAHSAEPVTVFPRSFDANCRDGEAKLYDECSDQFAVLKAATEEAECTGKVLVVSYGAEWCIWCHVLDSHLKGGVGMFNYEVEDYPPVMAESLGPRDKELAAELNAFAAKNIILVHIDAMYAPNGVDVLAALGAENDFKGGIPYIFSVKNGRMVGILPSKGRNDPKAKRRDGFLPYRGYNRDKLLAELADIVEAAR